jgi:hypothetical protein
MERLQQAPPKKAEAPKRPPPPPPEHGKFSKEVEKSGKQDKDKKVDEEKPTDASDFDRALAALHSGDYESAAALVAKLRRAAQEDPNNYQLAVVQLGLLVEEGKSSAQRQDARSAMVAFNKQVRLNKDEVPSVDRSV